MSSVYSFTIAIENECSPRAYSYSPDHIPLGSYEAVLDFKIWGKGTMSVVCYFTLKERKTKFSISVFRRGEDKQYRLPGGGVDFRDCPAPALYYLAIDKNGKGNPFLKDCRLIER